MTFFLSSLFASPSEGNSFVRFGDIRGESSDAEHKGWIEVQSYQWGVSVPDSGPSGTGSGAAKPVFSPFSYTQALDSSVPLIFTAAASGRRIEDMTFETVRTGERPQRFFQMIFEDVVVTGIRLSGQSGDTAPQAAVTTSYDKVLLRYFPQNPDGSLGAPIEGGWDLRTNRGYTGDPAALAGLFAAGGSIDNGVVTFASAVPEPSSTALMLAALGLLCMRLRARAKR
jgi:type VI secretion system secreted protein Hcp